MARVILECQDCGARFDVTRREPGSKVRCKSCRSVLKVPKKAPKQASPPREVPEGASARSVRAKRLEEKRKAEAPAEAAEAADNELREGELVQGLQPPQRSEPLSAREVIAAFLGLLKSAWGRLVTLSFVTVFGGLLISVLLLFVVAALFGQDQSAAEILKGLLALLSAFVTVVVEAAGVRIGRRALDERDEGVALTRGVKASIRDSWAALKRASRKLGPLLAVEAVFYFGLLLVAAPIILSANVPGIGTLLIFVGALFLVAFYPFFGAYTRFAMVGVVVEERPLVFSLKRAWVLLKDRQVILPLAVVFLLQIPILGLIVTVFQVATYILVFLFVNNSPEGLAATTAVLTFLFTKALQGFFYTALHFEITKDEGLA